jgi:hypothetical protein
VTRDQALQVLEFSKSTLLKLAHRSWPFFWTNRFPVCSKLISPSFLLPPSKREGGPGNHCDHSARRPYRTLSALNLLFPVACYVGYRLRGVINIPLNTPSVCCGDLLLSLSPHPNFG